MESSKLELWVAAAGLVVAGIVVSSWLAVGPALPSRIDVAVLVTVVTAFAWAAMVVGGASADVRETARDGGPAPRRSVCGEIHC